MSKIKLRSEIAVEDTWNLSALYPSMEEFDKDVEFVKEKIKTLPALEKIMTDSGKNLYDTITKIFETFRIYYKLNTYAHLKLSENLGDNNSIELSGKVSNLGVSLSQATDYYSTKITLLKPGRLKELIEEYPKLKEYNRLLTELQKYRKHTLSAKEEKLMTSLAKAYSNADNIYDILSDSDLKFGNIIDEEGEEVELTDTNYRRYVESTNRKVRKNAFEVLYKSYKDYSNTFASLLEEALNGHVTFSKIRKFKSALEESTYQDEVTPSIMNNLIKTVGQNLTPLFKYYQMKRDILKLEELHLYDIYVKLFNEEKNEYSFDEAKTLVLNAVEPLGEEYQKIIEKAFEERWIDIYPNKGKNGGAFSGGCYDSYPYILLNYQNRMEDVSTLIHELGHSVHSYYSRENNPFHLSSYQIFVAEVASTVNELLLSKYLLKTSKDDKTKLMVLNNLLELFKGTIYRQTMFAEFEQYMYEELEKDEVLTSDKLSAKYYEMNQKYFGDTVVLDEDIRYEWARIPHFYYNFYVYKYATGLSAACYIVESILEGRKNAAENYIEFLKQGNRLSPIEELKIAGVDLNKKEVILSAIHMFDETVDEFKTLYEKYKKSSGEVNE